MDTIFNTNLKAPFPYFGGKGLIADVVWQYLGDVKQYIEPFFGSGAVLLKRPQTKYDKIYEIVNDKDGFISNVWRSIIYDPDEVAKWCDWQVNHADLNARRKRLLENEQRLLEGLVNDDMFYDAKLAGYWIWAASCWIGSGLTKSDAIPRLTANQGITASNDVYQWMYALRDRLRHVKVVCGDWTRVCGGSWQSNHKPTGIFFDPPYATSGRAENLYHQESLTVGKDVEKWVLGRGENPDYRIVVCGYDDEYLTLIENGWKVHAWKANAGYARCGSRNLENRHRERLFISPHCLPPPQGMMEM
jgi:site-specific DNA-adenine methylase